MSFEKIKLIRPRRSVFKENNQVRTTANIGEVIPSMWREMVPGDTFHFGQVAQVELMPMVAPTKGDLWLESAAFFVPYDILAMGNEEKFTQIIAQTVDTQDAVPIPKWNLEPEHVTEGKLDSTAIGTLWDKFGFPLDLPALDNSVTPIAYLQRAYNCCYNFYIRDETLDSEQPLDSNEILTCCYKKDLFTSAFLSPQKGNAPYLELRGDASATWSNDVIGTIVGLLSNYQAVTGLNFTQDLPSESDIKARPGQSNGTFTLTADNLSDVSQENQNSDLGVKVNKALLDLLNNNKLDLSSVITFNIEELRTLNKLQLWLERNQLAGNRTKEYLLANYGIAPNDETLQMPVFLGRLRTPIMVSSVTSSLETTIDSQKIPQGTKTGNGYGTNAVQFKSWTCKEPGLILVLSYIRPKAAYSQGINRQWIKETVYDYYNPIFANLGNQEIKQAEIFANGVASNDTKLFGFTERNQELKTVPDVVTGDLRANRSLQAWSIGRHFANSPVLDSDFIHVNPKEYDYLFAIESSEQPQAVLTFHNIARCIRPIPKFSRGTL